MPDLAVVRLGLAALVFRVAVVIMTLLPARQKEARRKLTGTQFEWQPIAHRGRHIAHRCRSSQQETDKQCPHGELSDGRSQSHIVQFNANASQQI